jgi:RNA recognition motif-containing protein
MASQIAPTQDTSMVPKIDCVVYIADVNSDTKAEELLRHFHICGPMSATRSRHHRTVKLTIAYVYFANKTDRMNTELFSGTILHGRSLDVKQANTGFIRA